MEQGQLYPPGAATTPEAIIEAWREFLSHRSSEGRLVGKGVLFNLPVDISIEETGGGLYRITLTDNKKGSVQFEAGALARSKYRKQVMFMRPGEEGLVFRSFAYLDPLHTKLLEKVLEKTSPGECISKDEFDQITASIRRRGDKTQSDGPRRWRELRNEYGFDVRVEGDQYCRGEELPVREPQVRPDTSRLTADFLPELVSNKDDLRCAKCGVPVAFEIQGFVADRAEVTGVVDHRRPVVYGGTDDKGNLQILCVRCNNLKRTYCDRCPLGYRCERCSWAYPERVSDLIVISLKPEEAERFEELVARYKGKPPEVAKQLLMEAVEKYLKNCH